MPKRCTIILNDKAGALRITPGARAISGLCAEMGLEAEVVATRSERQMRALLRKLRDQGEKMVAVAGGDGTISAAVQELAHSSCVLGIIPQGTANNFATALRLPQDLPSALRVLRDGVVREVSLGKVGDRYFTEAAGIGLFADALSLYGKPNKNMLKGLLTFARIVFSLPRNRIRIVMDGKEVVERAAMCTVANAYRFGTAFTVAPEARLTDSHLDVVVVGDLRRRDLPAYFHAMRAQVHTLLPKVTTYTAKEIRIESRQKLPVHCDDRIVGTTPVTVTVQPKALKVMVDRL